MSPEMAATRRKPAPHCHPRATSATDVPPEPITIIMRPTRQAARSKLSSSGIVFVGIPHDRADQLHEAGNASEDQEYNPQPARTESFVEVVADRVSHECGDRQQERERGILGKARRGRLMGFGH